MGACMLYDACTTSRRVDPSSVSLLAPDRSMAPGRLWGHYSKMQYRRPRAPVRFIYVYVSMAPSRSSSASCFASVSCRPRHSVHFLCNTLYLSLLACRVGLHLFALLEGIRASGLARLAARTTLAAMAGAGCRCRCDGRRLCCSFRPRLARRPLASILKGTLRRPGGALLEGGPPAVPHPASSPSTPPPYRAPALHNRNARHT